MIELCLHHQLLDLSSPGTIVEISTASVSHGIVGGFVCEKSGRNKTPAFVQLEKES